jgi:hypothetical protein
MKKEAEKIAEEHAEWFAKTVKIIYRDAFIHGWKHAKETDD